MISFDFDYYKPSSIHEVIDTIRVAEKLGKQVVFYSGGTEFITFARTNQLHADTVIDLKGIQECTMLQVVGKELIIGAAVSINQISESKLFPLLGETVQKIADHTSRNKITIGGNLNSRFMYREGILPLLLADAKVKIAGEGKDEIVPLEKIFNREIILEPGTFIVQIIVHQSYLDLPFSTLKRTRMTKVGYPLATVAALVKEGEIRLAFSGVCEFPFRSAEIEGIMNESAVSVDERIERAIAKLPAPIVHDIHASAGYREFTLKNMLTDTMKTLEVN